MSLPQAYVIQFTDILDKPAPTGIYASGGGSYDAQLDQITLMKVLEKQIMTFSGRFEAGQSRGHGYGVASDSNGHL